MASRRVIMKVQSGAGCPLFSVGDRMVLQLPHVDMEASSAVCAFALAKLLKEVDAGNCPNTSSPVPLGILECPRETSPVVFTVECPGETASTVPEPSPSNPVNGCSSLTDILRRLDVFHLAPSEVLDQVAATLRKERYPPGSIILDKGEAGRNFVVLSEGEVEVFEATDMDGTERNHRVRAPARLGELSLLTGSPHSARIITRTPTTVLLLDGASFHRVLRDHPSVAHRFIQVLAGQVESTNSLLAREERFGFRGKLAVMNLSTVLQVLAEARHSGCLHLRSGSDTGFIGYNRGRIYTACYGSLEGAAAVYALLRWEAGDFWLENDPIPKRDNVEIGVMGLILEGMRRIDEETTA